MSRLRRLELRVSELEENRKHGEKANMRLHKITMKQRDIIIRMSEEILVLRKMVKKKRHPWKLSSEEVAQAYLGEIDAS